MQLSFGGIIFLLGVQFCCDGVETLTNMRVGDTNTVNTLHLIIFNYQGLLLFIKLIILNRCINLYFLITFLTLIFFDLTFLPYL